MKFDEKNYVVETLELEGKRIRFRAFRNIVYVQKPVDEEFQSLNIFVPEDFYEGRTVNGYNLSTAPVFMPNVMGGYMPGPADEPGYMRFGAKRLNAFFLGLCRDMWWYVLQ
jgi:hypothetical protein